MRVNLAVLGFYLWAGWWHGVAVTVAWLLLPSRTGKPRRLQQLAVRMRQHARWKRGKPEAVGQVRT